MSKHSTQEIYRTLRI